MINEVCNGESLSICCKNGVIVLLSYVIYFKIKNIELVNIIGS